jgi:hypothetical protein
MKAVVVCTLIEPPASHLGFKRTGLGIGVIKWLPETTKFYILQKSMIGWERCDVNVLETIETSPNDAKLMGTLLEL